MTEVLHSGRWTLSSPLNGAELFERRFARAFAAYVGTRYCVPVDHGSSALVVALDTLRAVHGRTLRVGFISPAGQWLLQGALRAFRSRSPAVEVVPHEMWSGHQVRAVRSGELDLGFVFGPIRDGRLRTHTVLHEPLVALLPVDHRLNGSGPLALSAFAREPRSRSGGNLARHCTAGCTAGPNAAGTVLRTRHSVAPQHHPLLVGAGLAVAVTSAARAAASTTPGVMVRGFDDPRMSGDVMWCGRPGRRRFPCGPSCRRSKRRWRGRPPVTPKLLPGHSGSWHLRRGENGDVATARHTVVINPHAVEEVLGPDRTLADARVFVREALGTNSRTTIAHARAYAQQLTVMGGPS